MLQREPKEEKGRLHNTPSSLLHKENTFFFFSSITHPLTHPLTQSTTRSALSPQTVVLHTHPHTLVLLIRHRHPSTQAPSACLLALQLLTPHQTPQPSILHLLYFSFYIVFPCLFPVLECVSRIACLFRYKQQHEQHHTSTSPTPLHPPTHPLILRLAPL